MQGVLGGTKMLELFVAAQNMIQIAEQKFFTRKNVALFFVFLAIAVLFLLPDMAHAANPLETMKTVYLTQAKDNAFPVLIMWTLILGIVISFAMGKFMPFILAVIASVVIAIAPDIAPNFTGSNFDVNAT